MLLMSLRNPLAIANNEPTTELLGGTEVRTLLVCIRQRFACYKAGTGKSARAVTHAQEQYSKRRWTNKARFQRDECQSVA